jgi:hypothetical protein
MNNQTIALNWLNSVHRAIPNMGLTLEQFISSLRLNSYQESIPEADFQEWLDSLGWKIKQSSTVANKVKDKMADVYGPFNRQIPTRKSIDSAFLNLASAAYSYLDSSLAVGLEVVNIGKVTADTLGNLAYSVSGSAISVLTIAKWLLLPATGFLIWSVYQNRDEAGKALVRRVGETGGKALSRVESFGGKAVSKVEDFGKRVYNKGTAKIGLNPKTKRRGKRK